MTIHRDDKIRTFVDAGVGTLAQHTFVSRDLQKLRNKKHPAALAAVAVAEPHDVDQQVMYRLNATGNIFYATTSSKLQGETQKLFESVTVLFAAMTKAMAKKGKNIFDYDAWGSLLRMSGFFVEVAKFQRHLEIQQNSITINTQIIQQLLPGISTGSSMEIAKGVLGAMNGAYTADKTKQTQKAAHLLFYCEELFGSASVTVRLFYASAESHKVITSSPCHKTSSTSFEQLQEADTFMFVSPEAIAAMAKNFTASPVEYDNLVNSLVDKIGK